MKIFGHPLIPSPQFIKVSNVQEIDKIPPHCVVYFDCKLDLDASLAHFCQANQVEYAVQIHCIKDLLIYAQLGAKYLISTPKNLATFQTLIKEYLLDSLLLCIIFNEEEMEQVALQGIDGVIFQNTLQG